MRFYSTIQYLTVAWENPEFVFLITIITRSWFLTWLCCSVCLAHNVSQTLSSKQNDMAAIVSPHHTGTSDYCTQALNLQMFMQNGWETHDTEISGAHDVTDDRTVLWKTKIHCLGGSRTDFYVAHYWGAYIARVTVYSGRERCCDVLEKPRWRYSTPRPDDCLTVPSLDGRKGGVLQMIIAQRKKKRSRPF